jgi:sec-independent protein translocase protein TatB
MFGIGFTEILLISIIAILFLGPDKLPETMVQIAKFIKGVKKTVGDAKGALEEEMKIADLKDEALNYKKQLDSATSELRSFKNIDLDDILEDEPKKKKLANPDTEERISETKVEQKNDVVTFKKKSRKKKEKTSEENTEKTADNTSDEKTEKKEGNA